MTAPITILVCALGGEGGGVLAEWLYQTAVRAGHPAQSTSVPGVAQRTGATTYYVEVYPERADTLGGRRPVFSLNPVPGEIDLLLSSELLETARHVGNGMASRERTLVISSTARALTVAEKMQMGDGRLDAAALVAALQRHARAAELLDFSELARQAGTVISAVLLGAVAASGALPIARSLFEDTIRASGKGVDASLRGFALAFDTVTARRAQQAQLDTALAAAPAPDLRTLARQRLADYQDAAYAQLYEQRLAQLEAAEAAAPDVPPAQRGAVVQELVRWLALWMAFDDIVQVAALKLRRARGERVRLEVAAREDEIVKLFDHFKPGVPEVAALLPAAAAQRLSAWDARRRARGLSPWALPLEVGTHTVLGALALRCLASLKGQRRRGSRFATEQALIERWLAALERGTREHWALGHEIAECGRLVKGYGSTNERGKHNLLHVVDHLAGGERPAAQRAEAVRAARLAALADDAGTALDRTLLAQGAPARPLRAQPLRFYKRRADTPQRV
jgi:indolepyruvate ferredoxin oxidoreductase beta subunit